MTEHPPRLVLASASPHRAQQLRQLGLDFELIPARLDEDRYKAEISDAERLASTLAREKARAVGRPGSVVIGSDQVAVLDQELLSKPGTIERAIDQLERLSGKTHTLLTAVCVTRGDDERASCDRSELTMRALERAALERYVRADDPTQCVGAYKLESRGAALFQSVRTADPTAITGLPLFFVVRALQAFGISIP